MINGLLDLVVNTDTRDPYFKAHSCHMFHKKLMEKHPDIFSVLHKHAVRAWFVFSGSRDAPQFPVPTEYFRACVAHGFSLMWGKCDSDKTVRMSIVMKKTVGPTNPDQRMALEACQRDGLSQLSEATMKSPRDIERGVARDASHRTTNLNS